MYQSRIIPLVSFFESTSCIETIETIFSTLIDVPSLSSRRLSIFASYHRWLHFYPFAPFSPPREFSSRAASCIIDLYSFSRLFESPPFLWWSMTLRMKLMRPSPLSPDDEEEVGVGLRSKCWRQILRPRSYRWSRWRIAMYPFRFPPSHLGRTIRSERRGCCWSCSFFTNGWVCRKLKNERFQRLWKYFQSSEIIA